ncbi:hypothetical protein PPOP_0052 [Paenibacillus popilliae ATCC 14706]|uniref:Uncharacterized protein n=1 Tax=Paenibacillus popilliae ATCC 14706 TaxID=1212764 RepID=M9LEZ6_PAEPP|nr:hypothetical protein PPOP_0052 [Paenibacillus popilliae ATCC 14706]
MMLRPFTAIEHPERSPFFLQAQHEAAYIPSGSRHTGPGAEKIKIHGPVFPPLLHNLNLSWLKPRDSWVVRSIEQNEYMMYHQAIPAVPAVTAIHFLMNMVTITFNF